VKHLRKKYLECGKAVGTHGVRGEVKVQPWCDSPEFLCGFKTLYLGANGEKPVRVVSARVHKAMALIGFEGINSIDEANGLRGKIIYIDRDDAPDDGKPFLQDLIGLTVLNADTGEVYGKLADVLETGANDVYSVRDETGKERLVPVIPQVIISTDIEGGEIRIRPLEGLFDEN
jgi:16S rRNA processing protein RimM